MTRSRRLWTPARRARLRASSRRPASVSSAWSEPLLCISMASASDLPPAPAHASTTILPGRAPQASAMSWLPSSWISKRPSRNERSANAFWWPSRTSPHGEWRVGSAPMPSEPSLPRSVSRSARSTFVLTVSGAREFIAVASVRASSSPSLRDEALGDPARQGRLEREPLDRSRSRRAARRRRRAGRGPRERRRAAAPRPPARRARTGRARRRSAWRGRARRRGGSRARAASG